MNLPNKITILRICMLPLVIFFYLTNLLGATGKLIALILFVFAIFTDMLDGYIARKYHLVTDFGKFLDPIADKILASTGLVLLIADSTPILPVPYGIIFIFIMLFRDYIVTGLRQMGQIKGVIIAADMLGKVKANLIYATLILGFLLAYFNNLHGLSAEFINITTNVFYVLSVITVFFIILSGISYLKNNSHVLSEKQPKNKKEKSE